MKIRCKLVRKDGTPVQIGTTTYHFKPDADGVHVADVKDPKHIKIFLNIPEAYAEYGKPDEPPAEENPLEKELAAAFPLADIDIESLTNAKLYSIAKAHLGIEGTAKDVLDNYAAQKLGIDNLSKTRPKAAYVDLLRTVMLEVQKVQRADKQEALLEGGDTVEGGA